MSNTFRFAHSDSIQRRSSVQYESNENHLHMTLIAFWKFKYVHELNVIWWVPNIQKSTRWVQSIHLNFFKVEKKSFGGEILQVSSVRHCFNCIVFFHNLIEWLSDTTNRLWKAPIQTLYPLTEWQPPLYYHLFSKETTRHCGPHFISQVGCKFSETIITHPFITWTSFPQQRGKPRISGLLRRSTSRLIYIMKKILVSPAINWQDQFTAQDELKCHRDLKVKYMYHEKCPGVK